MNLKPRPLSATDVSMNTLGLHPLSQDKHSFGKVLENPTGIPLSRAKGELEQVESLQFGLDVRRFRVGSLRFVGIG
jgi:hypothetical protein